MSNVFNSFKEAALFAKEQALKNNSIHRVKKEAGKWIAFTKEYRSSNPFFPRGEVYRNEPDYEPSDLEKKRLERFRRQESSWRETEPSDPEKDRLERLSRTRKTGQESSWRETKEPIKMKRLERTEKKNYVLCKLCAGDGGINQGCPKCGGSGWS